MIHRLLLVVVLAFAAATLGCDDEACVTGTCEVEGDCVDVCVEVCEGDVLDEFCTVDFLCECDCAIACLL